MIKQIKIDIFSDIACPWCYVGEKKFDLARTEFLNQNPSINLIINWHPYMIDPQTKEKGEDYLAYNIRRWGGDGWTYSLKKAGKKVGCEFKDWKIWPNTFLCHCLIKSAQDKGKLKEILDELFENCYENGKNVSDFNTLDSIAKKYDLSDWSSKLIKDFVTKEDRKAKEELDIHGVPFFRFEDQYSLEGAQNAETFLQVLNECAKLKKI